ncbi:MAG: sigma-54 interaction domain-containing protein, partial [Candidatus Binatia bacterium]
IGQSPSMRSIYTIIRAVSVNRSTVLISGESGTGKELVARTIHRQGSWADRPFVAINCGAMSETLLDSQLFGHRRGAFTGAIADHDGVFQAASGGTLFLDEVSEIPLALQVKFLRAIQEKEVTPLGLSRPVKVDVRIIAASNRNPEEEVKKGTFRDDLFYRLNVVPIHLPPLRERREDIPLLIEHFIAAFSTEYKVEPKKIAPAALEKLVSYPWPGNIRELQNVIERVFALSRSDGITLADLPGSITGFEEHPLDFQNLTELPTLESMERSLLAAALRKSQGNKNEAARILDIDRQRLYRKIEKYELDVSV